MNYRELMDRYRRGETTEAETALIREELEKLEVLQDRLAEESEAAIPGLVNDSAAEPSGDYQLIRRGVDRHLRRIILTTLALFSGLLVLLFLVISPVLNALYYDPGKQSLSRIAPDIDYDLQVLTELHQPGYSVSTALVMPRGFGRYELRYSLADLFDGQSTGITQILERGNSAFLYTEPLKEEPFQLRSLGLPDLASQNRAREAEITQLRGLNPLTWVSAALTFPTGQSLTQIRQLEEAHPQIQFIWARIKPFGDEWPGSVGIRLGDAPEAVHLYQEDGINERFPGLGQGEWLLRQGTIPVGTPIEAQGYEQKYFSLLDFAMQRSHELASFPDYHGREFYEAAASYARAEGIQVTGVLIHVQADELLRFLEAVPIQDIWLDQALPVRPMG